ncbi:class B sortase [Clostridia bacterium]|nr:class B sortase [Clostridia bacterium]
MKKRIINIILLLMILAGCFLISLHFWNIYQYNKAIEENERIKDTFYQAMGENASSEIEIPADESEEKPQNWGIREEYLTLLDENPDTVGWIKIEDTTIDLPVVQGKDNVFYLKHAYSGVWSATGTIFMDYRNDLQDDNNILVYGHTIRANNMFSELNHYVDTATGQEYYESHPEIIFNTLYQDNIYDIFSIYIVDLKKETYYIYPNYEGEAFETYLADIRSRSIIDSDLTITQADQMLTLVTCYPPLDDARVIVHAVKQ